MKFSPFGSKDGVTFILRFAYTAASRLDFSICGDIFIPIGIAIWKRLSKVVPATYFDCMVSFLHATVLGMGNFGNPGWDANIRACLI
jgi:hypothetical protein